MKVCYVTMQFPAPSETFASNDVRWLREKGVRVTTHGLRSANAACERLLEERGLDDLEVSHNSLLASLRGSVHALVKPRRAWRLLKWLLRATAGNRQHMVRSLLLLPRCFDILRRIEQEQPDLVHVYWAHYPSIVGRLVQEELPHIATSISFVAYDLEMNYGGSASVARRADVVRTLAQVSVNQVASTFGIEADDVKIVYDGIDVRRVDDACRTRRKVPGRLVTVGRLVERKGMYEALEVLARTVQQLPTARLRVLGSGPEESGLKRRAYELGVADSVDFLGHVDHERVMVELAEAQILLLLTKASGERLPNVVKEGMACRSVCVTTPTPGIEELIVDGLTGFVVPTGSVAEPAEVVQRVLQEELDVSSLLEEARRHVIENFDLNSSCSRYLQLWEDAVKSRKATAGTASRTGRLVRA